MFKIAKSHEVEIINSCVKEIKDAKVTIFPMDEYLGRYLDYCSSLGEVTYPRTIRIPRDLDYILKTGDYSPALEFVIEEPPMYNGKPIWTRDSRKQLGLGLGYLNGDTRYLSEFYLGENSPLSAPHMVIGGTSGGGKSVCMNNINFNFFFGYSPFDLEMAIIDAKINEGKRYTVSHKIPHIKVVGATEDVSYTISVLQEYCDLMVKRNKVFASVGCQNIKDFRDTTKLDMPRVVLMVDEYQYQYQKATTKEQTILTNLYDQFCTIGRNTGVHLVLCSQKYLAELKSKLFHNIGLRGCLMCERDTSNGIIENESAYGIPIGQLQFNSGGHRSLEETYSFKVPFQTKDDFERQGLFLQHIGDQLEKDFGCTFPMNSFNEDLIVDVETISNLVKKYGKAKRLVLGIPAFMKSKEIDVLYMRRTFDDLENIAFFSPDVYGVKDFIMTNYLNLKELNPQKHISIYSVFDNSLTRGIDFSTNQRVFELESFEDEMFKASLYTVLRKNIAIRADREIFANPSVKISERAVEIVKEHLGNNAVYKSDLNLKRLSKYLEFLSTDKSYTRLLTNGGTGADVKLIEAHAAVTLQTMVGYSQEFIKKQITKENIPTHYFHIIGFDKVKGLTRQMRSVYPDVFKDILFDANKSKCCFFIYSTLTSPYSPFKDAFGWVIGSSFDDSCRKMGVEVPTDIGRRIGLLIKPTTGDFKKFIKLNAFDPSDNALEDSNDDDDDDDY